MRHLQLASLGLRIVYVGLGVGAYNLHRAFLPKHLMHRGPKQTLATSANQGDDGLSNVADFRKEYSNKGLNEEDIPSTPFPLFEEWYNDAVDAKVIEPNAMCLSTCVNNKPSARYVLLKGYEDGTFVWYTNYNSRKSKELLANPHASLTFWWGGLERSIRIEGEVTKISPEESDAYFHSRPRGSRIGAWTSNQSSMAMGREQLQKQETDRKLEFGSEGSVPRPEHWGGFRLVPNKIEFWKGRESRLHDRICYVKTSSEAFDVICAEAEDLYGEEGVHLIKQRETAGANGWVFIRLQP